MKKDLVHWGKLLASFQKHFSPTTNLTELGQWAQHQDVLTDHQL
jgi:hypothetical protein